MTLPESPPPDQPAEPSDTRKPLLGSAAILQALKDEREARSAGLHPPVRTPHEDEAA